MNDTGDARPRIALLTGRSDPGRCALSPSQRWMFDQLAAHATAVPEVRAHVRAVRLGRDDDGRLRVHRVYDFEYSETGSDRYKGSVTLLGRQILAVHIAPV